MFLRLNNLTFKQWLTIKTIYFVKHMLPNRIYILFLQLISSLSKNSIMKNLYKLCPPSNFPQAATFCYKIKNLLTG
jgi:hypothetical protein